MAAYRPGGGRKPGWFFGLIAFIGFLNVYFRVPVHWSTFALLAIPLVQIHAGISYVDLPGSVVLSIFLLMVYLLYTRPGFATFKNLALMLLCAVCAANIKQYYLPPVVIGLVAVAFYQFKHRPWLQNQKPAGWWWIKTGFLSMLTVLLVFAVPLKNTLYYGNPFHNIRIVVGEHVLSEGESFTYDIPHNMKPMPAPVRWMLSILEFQRPAFSWTAGQHLAYTGPTTYGEPGDRMGGYFRDYVLFQLLLFGVLAWRLNHRETRNALILMGALTVFTAFYPMSFQLRYSMYWMLMLVALNLALIRQFSEEIWRMLRLDVRYICLLNFYFFFVVALGTQLVYLLPLNKPVAELRRAVVGQRLKSIAPGGHYCAHQAFPYTFVLTSVFNPGQPYTIEDAGEEITGNLTLKAGPCKPEPAGRL